MSGDKVTVKTEAAATFKRLPSFKPPRDLKLSQFSNPLAEARTKKVFVPNLNVQRKKQNESQEGTAESSNERRERNRREDRQRQKKNFVQGQGIFSEGLAPQMKRFSSGGRYSQDSSSGGGGGGSGASIPKPKLKLNEPIKVDQNEEELIMKELMRDDFIDDPASQPDMDDSPVNLPLRKMEDLKVKDSKEEIPKLNAAEAVQVNGVRIKQETVPQPQVCNDEKPIDISELRTYTAAEIIHNQAQDNNFIFFQIPNSIPRLKVPEIAKTTSANKKSQKEEEEEGIERCSLRSLPPGQIGTLQILKSGRARLLLGDVKLKIESGTQVAFQKELVSVDLNASEKTGNIIHVGNLTTRILVTPDWETLIKTNKTT